MTARSQGCLAAKSSHHWIDSFIPDARSLQNLEYFLSPASVGQQKNSCTLPNSSTLPGQILVLIFNKCQIPLKKTTWVVATETIWLAKLKIISYLAIYRKCFLNPKLDFSKNVLLPFLPSLVFLFKSMLVLFEFTSEMLSSPSPGWGPAGLGGPHTGVSQVVCRLWGAK